MTVRLLCSNPLCSNPLCSNPLWSNPLWSLYWAGILSGVTFASMLAGAFAAEVSETAKGLKAGKSLETAVPLRVPWTTSRVVGSPEPPSPYRPAKMYERLSIPQPIYAAQEPGTAQLFVVELQRGKEPGRIHRIVDDEGVRTSEVLFSMDRLIYGLTFHPQYARNRQVFVYSNGPIGATPKFNRISRLTVPETAGTPIDPASEEVILEWESNGHNGGEPGFGPDGMLYAATGDGTSDSDPLQTGQGVDDLLAVMLRIDVDHPAPGQKYAIPADNPFVGDPKARGEIWAFGFRNPWRMTFDRRTGQLWTTQNGQDLWEQVYLVRKGENYGWSVQEGSHPFYPNRPSGPGQIVPPVAEHHHTEARSLTGGVVYYGQRLPELQGAYIYGDYSTGRIWGIRHDGQRVTWHQELCDTPFSIVGFVETPSGELAVIDQHTGFYRLEAAPPVTNPQAFPRTLTETGLFASVAEHKLAPGVIGYSVNTPLWSDGASKDRFLAVPGWQQVDFTPTRAWQFPEGTVLVKTFSLETRVGDADSRRRIETRIMTLQQKEWAGYTYRWNADQTEATLVGREGLDITVPIQDAGVAGGERQQAWHFPSRAECMVCHSRAAQFVLGLCTEQLNRVHQYPEGEFPQLQRLSQLGLLRAKLQEHPQAANHWKQLVQSADPVVRPVGQMLVKSAPVAWQERLSAWGDAVRKPPATLPWLGKSPEAYTAFPDPTDDTQPLDIRVRAYLHVNCAVCHQDAGGGNSQIDLRFTMADDKRKLFDVAPLHSSLGIENAKLVAAGDPERSVLLQRMKLRGRGQMPPLASAVADPVGVELLTKWIRQLPPPADGSQPTADTKSP